MKDVKHEKNNGSTQTSLAFDGNGVLHQFGRGIDSGLRGKNQNLNGDDADDEWSIGKRQQEFCDDSKRSGNRCAPSRCDRGCFLYDRPSPDFSVQSHRKSLLMIFLDRSLSAMFSQTLWGKYVWPTSAVKIRSESMEWFFMLWKKRPKMKNFESSLTDASAYFP